METKLLLGTNPMLIDPDLATIIGLNESIFLQQVQYWILHNKEKGINFKEGYYWTYNSYEGWNDQFPFWSVSKIRRIISKLEQLGFLITANYNKLGIDRTRWYRVNYDKIDEIRNQQSLPSVQNEQIMCSEWTDQVSNMNRPLPETSTETTTENKKDMIYNLVFADAKREEYGLFKLIINGHTDTLGEYYQLVEYFFQKYRESFGEYHPALKNEQIEYAIKRMEEEYCDDEMIDIYFSTEFYNWKVDYNLNHFVSGEIMQMVGYEQRKRNVL